MGFVLRFVVAVIFGGILAWACFSRYDEEIGEEAIQGAGRYNPYLNVYFLPAILVAVLCVSLPKVGLLRSVQLLVSFCFGIFLSVSVYYPLLSLLLPVLRKHISARGCAVLWLIPNYLCIMYQDFMSLPEPWLVLPVSDTVFYVAVGIWLTGFLGILLWKTVEHFRFRREILKNARPVTDPEILRIWQEEKEKAGVAFRKNKNRTEERKGKASRLYRFAVAIVQPRLTEAQESDVSEGFNMLGVGRKERPDRTLVISPQVRMPLSIDGLFTHRVVLPERSYTSEELALILRHELVHICRDDSSNKFYLVFCKALCWFHPLMWFAMEKSAEDLELSCDETVLLGADDQTRRQYAELLLQTAGDGRGFTTCLSASAASVRYRLKQIVNPRKVSTGAIAVFLAFTVLCMSFGYVALSFDASTCAQAVFGDTQPELTGVYYHGEDGQYLECSSEEALLEYLAQLPVSRLAGDYSWLGDDARTLTVLCRGADSSFSVTLQENTLLVRPLNGENSQKTYYLGTEVDWEYILTLMN